ncbi:MAG: hypothetical protein EPN33_01160 [Acidobacteria bacterium]|nr:MAG: hypothetical protein EPN33_01160 [Acidobacteriota bacterium]
MVKRRTFRLGFLLLLAAAAAAALGESRVRIVVISFLEHRVQVELPPPPNDPQQALRWTTAVMNAPVIEGESIRTQIQSDAEIELECGSALRLAPGSELTFNRLRLSNDGVPITTVTLHLGEAFFTMQDADSRDFETRIGGGVIRMPDGGAKLRLDAPAGKPASVEVLNGQVLVQTGGLNETVHSTRRFEFAPRSGIRLLSLLKPDQWQLWSKRRDEAFQRAVLAAGPKPPAQFSASAPNPSSITPTPGYAPDVVQGLFNSMDSKNPVPGHPLQGPTPPVPHCAHRG